MIFPRQTIINRIPAWVFEEGEVKKVGFRVLYQGQLLSSNTNNGAALKRNKNAIRKQLHPQLRRLWETHPTLISASADSPTRGWTSDLGLRAEKTKFERGEFEFIPLISTRYHLVCSLDVLFLRREAPGALVQGGDVDNRINTLFDAMRIPETSEIDGEISPKDNPFYCLVEDDRLVTEVKITTDRLLTEMEGDPTSHEKNNVVLVIKVEIEQTTKLW